MKKDKRTALEKQRDRLVEQLETCVTNSDQYEKLTHELSGIMDLIEKEKKMKPKISPDTVATIGANLLGIGLVAGFEYLHMLPHKAFTMIKRLF